MTSSGATTPLLDNTTTSMGQPAPRAARAPSGFTTGTISTLAVLKMVLGASCVIAPQLAGRLFLLDITPQAVIMARLFGSSCAALGALTWSLNRPGSADLPRVVALNVAADAVDLASCSVGYAAGMFGMGAFGMLGGGAVALALLGIVGFKGL